MELLSGACVFKEATEKYNVYTFKTAFPWNHNQSAL